MKAEKSAIDHTAHAAAHQVIEELDEATQLARETLNAQQPSAAALVEPAPAAEMSDAERAARKEDRVQLFIRRAARQRQQGLKELERVYSGVMVVDREIKIFDPHIASSVTRFLGLTDKTIHLVGRIGRHFMSDAQIEKLQQSIQEMCDTYVQEGRQAAAVAAELSQKGRAANFMWIEPHYLAPALEVKFQVKSRSTLALAEAAQHWDEAIRLMCEMEFNACTTSSQISEVRLRERRLFAALNKHCVTIIMGMSRRSMAAANERNDGHAASPAPAMQEAEPARAEPAEALAD
jgi:hypothetical protein